jgi:hypothetical protein
MTDKTCKEYSCDGCSKYDFCHVSGSLIVNGVNNSQCTGYEESNLEKRLCKIEEIIGQDTYSLDERLDKIEDDIFELYLKITSHLDPQIEQLGKQQKDIQKIQPDWNYLEIKEGKCLKCGNKLDVSIGPICWNCCKQFTSNQYSLKTGE